MRVITTLGLCLIAAVCGCRTENDNAFGSDEGRTSKKGQPADPVPQAPAAETPTTSPSPEPEMVPTSAGGRELPPDAGGPRPPEAPP